MPVIDDTFMALPFIPGDPYDLVTSGQYSDVDVMIGGTKDEGIIYLLGAGYQDFTMHFVKYFYSSDVLGGDSKEWDEYRADFNTTGTKTLFMIPFPSNITAQDVERTGKLVEFYLGSYDNITEDNAAQLINMFSESGINISILYNLDSIFNPYYM